jgi:protein-tyrosine phosphatase
VIDLHCHPLPGVDDGPADMDEAIALVRRSVEQGIHTIVATPHIDHRWDVDPLSIGERVAEVQAAVDAERIEARILPGGEIALTRLVDLDDAELDAVRLGGGPYLMLEAPLTVAGGDFEPLIADLRARGCAVLIAHPERCPAFLRERARLERLIEGGALAQITASSLGGGYGKTIQRYAIGLVCDGLAHVVATDAHDAYRRSPEVRRWLESAGRRERRVEQLAAWMTERVPRAILDGDEPPAPPPSPARRPGRPWPLGGRR